MNNTSGITYHEWENFFNLSQIESVEWISDKVYAGFRTDFEVRTSRIAGLTQMEITCLTEDGKLLDFDKVVTDGNQYYGMVFIPPTIQSNTQIHLIVQLPQFNISLKSDSVSVKTSLKIL